MHEAEPVWPAIVKLGNDDELFLVDNLAQWEQDVTSYKIDESDRLIDSIGAEYLFKEAANGRLVLRATGKVNALKEILGLVKAHAAQAGSCCVAKMYAPSIGEAFSIVKSLTDD